MTPHVTFHLRYFSPNIHYQILHYVHLHAIVLCVLLLMMILLIFSLNVLILLPNEYHSFSIFKVMRYFHLRSYILLLNTLT